MKSSSPFSQGTGEMLFLESKTSFKINPNEYFLAFANLTTELNLDLFVIPMPAMGLAFSRGSGSDFDHHCGHFASTRRLCGSFSSSPLRGPPSRWVVSNETSFVWKTKNLTLEQKHD